MAASVVDTHGVVAPERHFHQLIALLLAKHLDTTSMSISQHRLDCHGCNQCLLGVKSQPIIFLPLASSLYSAWSLT
jgi:hypothetical protein